MGNWGIAFFVLMVVGFKIIENKCATITKAKVAKFQLGSNN